MNYFKNVMQSNREDLMNIKFRIFKYICTEIKMKVNLFLMYQ